LNLPFKQFLLAQMKKLFFAAALACAALAGQPVAAQVSPTTFAETGTEWWYSVQSISGPYYVHVVSIGDTLVAGQPGFWKWLTSQVYVDPTGSGTFAPVGTPAPFAYTQTRGAQVWAVRAQDPTLRVFRYLDFSLQRNNMVDTVMLCQNRGATIEMVDSVGTIPTAGRIFRTQWHSAPTFPTTNELRQYTGRVVEEVGYPNAVMFPEPECGTDPDVPTLVYYGGANGFSYGTRPTRILSVAEAVATRHLSLAPNPSANGRFKLEGLTDKTATYAIYDAQGRRVRAGKLTAADATLNLSDLPGGLYMLRGEVSGSAFTRRLVRE
jgi:Secretion system C-terminal sorting domain